MSDRDINIITAANDAYFSALAVMLFSLGRTLANGRCANVHILTADLSASNESLLYVALSRLAVNIRVLRVKTSSFEDLKISGHISLETYLRLLAPGLFPDLPKALYLDADIVVRQSVHELYDETVEGAHLLAVPHISMLSAFFGAERGIPSYRLRGIHPLTRTFNAGVMLLNLTLWRETAVSDRVLQYLRDFKEHVLWWDQDGLNSILYGCWKPLPVKWNLMTSHFSRGRTWKDSTLDEESYRAAQEDPAIVHYSFVPKPWEKCYDGPFGALWKSTWLEVSQAFTTDQAVAR